MKIFSFEKCLCLFDVFHLHYCCVNGQIWARAHTARSIPGNVAVVIAMIMAIAKNRHNQLTVWTKVHMKEQKKKLLWIEKQKSSTQNQPMWKEISRIRLKIKHAYFYFYIGNEMNKINGGKKSLSQKQNEKCVSFVDVDLEYTRETCNIASKEGNKRKRSHNAYQQQERALAHTHTHGIAWHGMAKMWWNGEREREQRRAGWMGR